MSNLSSQVCTTDIPMPLKKLMFHGSSNPKRGGQCEQCTCACKLSKALTKPHIILSVIIVIESVIVIVLILIIVTELLPAGPAAKGEAVSRTRMEKTAASEAQGPETLHPFDLVRGPCLDNLTLNPRNFLNPLIFGNYNMSSELQESADFSEQTSPERDPQDGHFVGLRFRRRFHVLYPAEGLGFPPVIPVNITLAQGLQAELFASCIATTSRVQCQSEARWRKLMLEPTLGFGFRV